MTLSSGRCRVLLCVLLGCGILRGQALAQVDAAKPQDAPKISFEVATIKPIKPGISGNLGFESLQGGRVEVGHASLKMLVMYAFHVPEMQIVDNTIWGGSKRYDIVGLEPASAHTEQQVVVKAEPNEVQREMIRSLLVERFGLKWHIETRQGPVYVLSRGSEKLMLEAPKHEGSDPRGGVLMMSGGVADGTAFGNNISMKLLAEYMGPWLERPVIDETGLKGSYDFFVKGDDPTNHDMTLATIRAMDRLGLQLKAGKGPIEIVVIDEAHEPSEN